MVPSGFVQTPPPRNPDFAHRGKPAFLGVDFNYCAYVPRGAEAYAGIIR